MPFFFWPRPFYVPLILWPDRFCKCLFPPLCRFTKTSGDHRPRFTGGSPAGSSWFCFILPRPTFRISELAAAQRSRTAQIFSCHRGPRNRKTYGAASPPEGDCWWPRRCTPSLAPALASPGSLRGSCSATTLPAPARNHARDQGRRLLSRTAPMGPDRDRPNGATPGSAYGARPGSANGATVGSA